MRRVFLVVGLVVLVAAGVLGVSGAGGAAGSVVGSSTTKTGQTHAVLWTLKPGS